MNKIAILFVIIPAALTSCSSLKPIEFRAVENFKVSKLSLNPEVSAEVRLFNPNPVGAKLKNFRMDFFIRSDSLTSIYLPDVTRAAAGREFSVPFSTSLSVIELANMLPGEISNVKSGKDLPVEMKGTITVKKFIFSKTFPFHFTETIEAKKIR